MSARKKSMDKLAEQAETDPEAALVLLDERQENIQDYYAAMLGKTVVVFCNFIYTGVLLAIDADTVWLENPAIIYDTGQPTAATWADVTDISTHRHMIQRSSIESMGVEDRTPRKKKK